MSWRMAFAGAAGASTGILLGGFFGYQLLDRSIPVTVVEEKALNYLVKPEDIAHPSFTFYRDKSCWTRADADWKDSKGRRWPLPPKEWPYGLLPLGKDVAVVDIPVPKGISAGPLRYESTNSYGCNWLSYYFWPIVAAPRAVDFWVEKDNDDDADTR